MGLPSLLIIIVFVIAFYEFYYHHYLLSYVFEGVYLGEICTDEQRSLIYDIDEDDIAVHVWWIEKPVVGYYRIYEKNFLLDYN